MTGRIILFCLFLLFLPGISGQAQSLKNAKSLSGLLLKRPWSKSAHSFCAGGSDYFILQLTDGEEIVLRADRKKLQEQLDQYADQPVTVLGKFKVRVIPVDPMLPHPTPATGHSGNESYTCDYFSVRNLKAR